MATATALLHLESELRPGADVDGFNAWCDHHHAEVLRVPGFLCARRFVQLSPHTAAPTLLTLYDLADAAVLDGDAYAAHGRDHRPLPERLAGALTFTRSVWRAAPPHDHAAGDAIVWERSEPNAPASPLGPRADEVAWLAGVRPFVPADPAAGDASLTLIEVRSVDDLAAVLRGRSAAGPGRTRRTYRQVFHANG